MRHVEQCVARHLLWRKRRASDADFCCAGDRRACAQYGAVAGAACLLASTSTPKKYINRAKRHTGIDPIPHAPYQAPAAARTQCKQRHAIAAILQGLVPESLVQHQSSRRSSRSCRTLTFLPPARYVTTSFKGLASAPTRAVSLAKPCACAHALKHPRQCSHVHSSCCSVQSGGPKSCG